MLYKLEIYAAFFICFYQVVCSGRTDLIIKNSDINRLYSRVAARWHRNFTGTATWSVSGVSKPGSFYQLLHVDNSHVIIGSRDVAWNISIPEMRIQKTLMFDSDTNKRGEEYKQCREENANSIRCYNKLKYIRIFQKVSNNNFRVCASSQITKCLIFTSPNEGSTYFNPKPVTTIEYKEGEVEYLKTKDVKSKMFMVDLQQREEYMFMAWQFENIRLGKATFNNEGNLVYRSGEAERNLYAAPKMIATMNLPDRVLFFNSDKRGPTVAQMCKNDVGWFEPSSGYFSISFALTVLKCGFDDDLYHVLDAVSEMGLQSQYGNDIIYGVFSIKKNIYGVFSNAICAFRKSDIINSYKDLGSLISKDLALSKADCKNLANLQNGVKEKMFQSYMSEKDIQSIPVSSRTSLAGDVWSNWTSIAVDWRVPIQNSSLGTMSYVDVLYVGTSCGYVHKIVRPPFSL